MARSKGITLPVYRKIAVTIAQDIVGGKYVEGQKLSGRTVLSSQYGVSPETIRKAVHLLEDVEILDIKKNSGVWILSSQKAAEFIQESRELQSAADVKGELLSWMERQIAETSAAMEKLLFVLNTEGRAGKNTPFVPYEVAVPANSQVAGKSISGLNFWHKTGATIIAIERGEQIILSPGPYSSLLSGDILYIVGDERTLLSAIHFVTSANDG
ncbi:TrkA C-terminal domain-containing protein [Oscillibacter sp. GMB15532]|uniref:TrkA C-terminal domain-containing protein n=1 Tax=Oscillibacter sp. GMB15532 TaxID=3230022 RepID=UPI0034DFBCE1